MEHSPAAQVMKNAVGRKRKDLRSAVISMANSNGSMRFQSGRAWSGDVSGLQVENFLGTDRKARKGVWPSRINAGLIQTSWIFF